MFLFCFPTTFEDLRSDLHLCRPELYLAEIVGVWSDKVFQNTVCTLSSFGVSGTLIIYETKYVKLWLSLKNLWSVCLHLLLAYFFTTCRDGLYFPNDHVILIQMSISAIIL